MSLKPGFYKNSSGSIFSIAEADTSQNYAGTTVKLLDYAIAPTDALPKSLGFGMQMLSHVCTYSLKEITEGEFRTSWIELVVPMLRARKSGAEVYRINYKGSRERSLLGAAFNQLIKEQSEWDSFNKS